LKLPGQRVDDAGSDAVQSSGGLVVAGLELAPCVKDGEDDLQGTLLRGRMLIDRNTPAVVLDGDRRAVGVQRDRDVRGVPVHHLIDRVVEDFPDEMVKPARPDTADEHPGTFADGLQPLQDRDVFRGVVRGRHV
jgi:hypothetical protein